MNAYKGKSLQRNGQPVEELVKRQVDFDLGGRTASKRLDARIGIRVCKTMVGDLFARRPREDGLLRKASGWQDRGTLFPGKILFDTLERFGHFVRALETIIGIF